MQKILQMSQTKQSPISIIGAGIGGTTLSRALSNRGIPSVIYERVASASIPRHGYGITLHAATYRPLLDILNIDEKTFRQRVAVDGPIGGNGRIDGGKVVSSARGGSFRAHRGRLEELIREGLDIRWGHTVEKVEAADHGPVSLCFEDGKETESRCVVGVDGVHAVTRKSCLPSVQPDILPFVAFNGKRRVKRSVFEEVYAPAMGDSTVVEQRKNGTLLNVSVNDNAGDLVSISWVFSRAARGSTDACYKPNRPNSAATDIPEEFYEEVGALCDLPQPFKDVFEVEKLKSERILSWLMRTVDVDLPQLQEMAKQGIVFMGDSVHAEAILGGEGANMAILDGLDLAQHIEANDVDTIARWYEQRHSVWQESLAKSKWAIKDMHADSKSVL